LKILHSRTDYANVCEANAWQSLSQKHWSDACGDK